MNDLEKAPPEDTKRRSTTGLLLVNLGTPNAPTTAAVREYLDEFLSDPRVLDIPKLARKLLLRCVILPFRSPKSAAAYRKVWMRSGSPLLVHSKRLVRAIHSVDHDVPIELAMRYGNPSIRRGLRKLVEKGCERIVVAPLYPQFAESSTGSTIAHVERYAKRMKPKPKISFVPAFYDDPGFIESFAAVARREFATFQPDHVLFSFHGLPERHVKRTDRTGKHCLQSATCCDAIVDANRDCYRAQCHATARALTRTLGLDPGATTIAFQSRLGRTPWIRPFTDFVLDELAAKGVRRLAVLCPAFVADCLETLEEIGIRGKEQFERRGGQLLLVPSLNSSTPWARTVLSLAARAGLATTAPTP